MSAARTSEDMAGEPQPAILFEGAAGAVATRAAPVQPDRDAGPGVRVRVEVGADVLAAAHRAGDMDLEAMIPGGPPVPGVDPGMPVELELRLRSEPERLLSQSRRDPSVLVADLAEKSADGRSDLLLLTRSWVVAAVRQPAAGRGLDLRTLHDSAEEVGAP